MDSQLWAVAIKGNERPEVLKQKTEGLCSVTHFPVPASGLRVGTLDSLMSLSDDLIKMDTFSEATTFKLYKQLQELREGEEPTVGGGAATARRSLAAAASPTQPTPRL